MLIIFPLCNYAMTVNIPLFFCFIFMLIKILIQPACFVFFPHCLMPLKFSGNFKENYLLILKFKRSTRSNFEVFKAKIMPNFFSFFSSIKFGSDSCSFHWDNDNYDNDVFQLSRPRKLKRGVITINCHYQSKKQVILYFL